MSLISKLKILGNVPFDGESTRNSKGQFPMASIRRGEIFLVNFDPTIGSEAKKTSPAVVVSNDINNAHSPIVSISPITSNVTRVYSFEVEVPSGTALPAAELTYLCLTPFAVIKAPSLFSQCSE